MNPIDDDTRCRQTTLDGRRCRMPRVNSSVIYCGTHLKAQQERLRREPARQARDVLDGVPNFRSAVAVKHVLTNVAGLVADGRMDYRKAVVLGYLSQLVLQTINLAKDEGWDESVPREALLPPSDYR